MGLGTLEDVLGPDCSGRIGDGIHDPDATWLGTDCSCRGGVGDGARESVAPNVEFSEAVTPVARDTLLGV